MHTHRAIRTGLVALVALAVVLAGVPGVATAETRSGGTVVVGAGEVVDEGLQVFAGTAVIEGTVNGDVEVFAGTVIVEGTVDGDLSTFGGSVELAEGAVVTGALNAAAGDVTVAGQVGGNVDVGAGTILLADTARIGGDLNYDGELVREGGSVVGGAVTQDGTSVGPVDLGAFDAVFAFYGLLASLLLGALVLLAFPGTSDRVAATALTEPLRAGGVGLLTLVAVPIALVLVAITVIGIPITIVGALLFAVVAWVATVFGRLAVGTWLLSYADVRNRWAGLLVGFLVVAAVGYVPFVGSVVDFVVFLLGLGALALVVARAYRGTSGSRPTEPVGEDPESDRFAA
ncbi:bactofilin family protein [Halomarina litorea]|uniref:bactofilin family protein n=1 Tax=Halomarina litorea TaxID=2961595 RepID=UPI0020C35FDB|nr:polymer-forming cytoskeletal protein [Halomarina sp. BCD28]